MKLLLTFLIVAPAFAAQSSKDKAAGLYSGFGKRDPFRVPDRGGVGDREDSSAPIRKFRLEGYRLRAIMRVDGKPQAMFEDPEGRSHVITEGERIGQEGARVSRIVDSEVIVTERGSNYLGKETLLEKVISLPPDSGGAGTPDKAAGLVQQGFTASEKGAPK